MRLPNFMIVGAAKAGSTSLAYYLSQHSDVYIAPVKETRFFSNEYEKGLSYYGEKFFPSIAEEQVIGEADVTYFMRPYVAHRIKESLGDIKIIILVRDPVDRAFSGYLMAQRDQRCEKRALLDLLIENKQQLDEYDQLIADIDLQQVAEEKYSDLSWKSEILQSGHYYQNIMRFEKYFSPDNIKVLFFENLVKNPTEVCAEVFRFLKIADESSGIDISVRNAYMSESVSKLNRLASFAGVKSLIPSKLKDTIKSSLAKRSEKPVLGKEERAWLSEYYRELNAQLGQHLGVDLSHWK